MPCPYLGTKEDRSLMFSESSPSNACYAQATEEKKLFRTITVEYADIPKKTQQEWCLSEDKYSFCPYYAAQTKRPASSGKDRGAVGGPSEELEDRSDQGLKKAAILAACFVVAGLILGGLFLILRGKPAPEPPPSTPPVVAAEPSPTVPAATPLAVSTLAPGPSPSPSPGIVSAPTPRLAQAPTQPPKPPVASAGSRKPGTSGENRISEIRVVTAGETRRVQVALTETAEVLQSKFLPADPAAGRVDRVYVDLKGVKPSGRIPVLAGEQRLALESPLHDDLIADIRASVNTPAPNLVTRLVIDLTAPASFEVKTEPAGFTVILSRK